MEMLGNEKASVPSNAATEVAVEMVLAVYRIIHSSVFLITWKKKNQFIDSSQIVIIPLFSEDY